MTEQFIKINKISLEELIKMAPGSELGPFRQGYMVNSRIRKGGHNSGYPEAQLKIKRFDYEGFLWGVVNFMSGGSSDGPDIRGKSAEDILKELESELHCFPGEIRNLGE